MSTDPNPQHLLRRPKKAQTKTGGPVIIAASIGAVVLIGGTIGAFALFGHSKTAAAGMPATSTAQLASAPVSAVVEPAALPGAVMHRGAHKAHTASSKPDGTPSPTPSPDVTATPAPAASATTDHTSAAALAAANATKAKHEAAVRLAALRRQQAVAGGANEGTPAQTTTAVASNAVPVATPAQTQAPAPATAAPDATPLYEPRVVVDARFISRVAPTYPDIAREQGASGTAIVLATVGPTGNVISVAIDQSTGNKLLDAAAMSAARASRFAPPEIDGSPATETYRIVYTFDPNG